MSNNPAQTNLPPGYIVAQNPQMLNAPVQTFNPSVAQPYVTSQQPPVFHQKFIQGKPKALGIVLIVVGIIHIGLGIGLVFTATGYAFISGIPFWGAVFCIVAGALSIAAENKPSICLVKGSMGLNIVISIISVLGFIFNMLDFFLIYCVFYDDYCKSLVIGGHVIRGIFILTYLILFSISISISVFGGRAINHPPPTTQVYVMQNSAAVQQPTAFPGSYPAYPTQPAQQQP